MLDFEPFDERDNVFARRDLLPSTPEYEDLYRRHPEWRVLDDALRQKPELGAHAAAVDMRFFDALAAITKQIGAPQVVDGAPAATRILLAPERAAVKIKAFARELGSDLVGISRIISVFVYSHRGRTTYPQEKWGSPLVLKHSFAISLGFQEDVHLIRTAPKIGELLGTGLAYYRSAVVAVALAEYVRSLGYSARAHHFRNYQVLPVPLAAEAGLGELGRCGFLMTKKFGNCLRLATVTTDLPLLCDMPVDIGVDDFCNRCKICAESCPAKAIPLGDKVGVRGFNKWQIDANRCYSYWIKASSDCGVCIASCPWSQPDVWWHRTAAHAATQSKLARMILLWIHPLIFGKYKPRVLPDWLEK
ncbi:MAG: 4Fe-4S dicluster domain-containing protein [bacterium]